MPFYPKSFLPLVVANYALFASAQARKLIRLVAPPLPKKSADFSGSPCSPRRRFALRICRSWRSHIPFGRSFNFQRALRGLSLDLEEFFHTPSLIDKIAPLFLNPFFEKFLICLQFNYLPSIYIQFSGVFRTIFADFR